MSKIIVSCEKLSKSYPVPNAPDLVILNEVDWEMEAGKLVAITGQSGCGKSTFMNILGLLDRQTSGKLVVDDLVFENSRDNVKLAAYRSQKIGFIFQQHYLLPELTAIQNVMSAELIRGKSFSVAKANAEAILCKLFHEDEIGSGVYNRLPEAMSGGQCQRVAIARALVGNPPLILADEPTGNLDEVTSRQVFDLFLKLQHELGISTIMVTHNPTQARQTDLSYQIHHQQITVTQ
ncbi:MAG: ABC transporter ATP-binding protein [Planctomycetia bacterium]|nr:ABC transporter ATP-binding protein [Planctomycetia bacterium]